jgi:formamidopyrimidine-DNA glycosylase
MPELPEVETVVRTLRPGLTGKTVAQVTLLRPGIIRSPNIDLPSKLTGVRIQSIHRRGKKILISLDNRCTLCIHLGMTGQLTVEHPGSPLRSHTHLILTFKADPDHQLRFRDPRRFGGVWWLACDQPPDANLGPEPLSIRPLELARRLQHTRRPIKSALLDQSLLAGLGNIYADESLFAAAIHPRSPANQLSPEQIRRLTRAIKKILRQAIRLGGSSLSDQGYTDANGRSGQFQNHHQVYGRKNHPCPRCRTPIRRIVLAGRSTHFCPQCQQR